MNGCIGIWIGKRYCIHIVEFSPSVDVPCHVFQTVVLARAMIDKK